VSLQSVIMLVSTYIHSIKYQSKYDSLLHKIQFRTTCFDYLLSYLQALKEQIQGNQSSQCILGSQTLIVGSIIVVRVHMSIVNY